MLPESSRDTTPLTTPHTDHNIHRTHYTTLHTHHTIHTTLHLTHTNHINTTQHSSVPGLRSSYNTRGEVESCLIHGDTYILACAAAETLVFFGKQTFKGEFLELRSKDLSDSHSLARCVFLKAHLSTLIVGFSTGRICFVDISSRSLLYEIRCFQTPETAVLAMEIFNNKLLLIRESVVNILDFGGDLRERIREFKRLRKSKEEIFTHPDGTLVDLRNDFLHCMMEKVRVRLNVPLTESSTAEEEAINKFLDKYLDIYQQIYKINQWHLPSTTISTLTHSHLHTQIGRAHV